MLQWKKEWRIVLILVLEFSFFLTSLYLLSIHNGRNDTWWWSPLFVLLSTLFLVSTLFTILSALSKRNERLAGLAASLDEEQRQQVQLKQSFERNIEHKTFELQKIVGALNREIGERTQAEEELRELQKQHELILDSAGDGILGLDNKGRVIFMNSAAEVMLGRQRKELINHTHHQLIHHSYADGKPYPVENCPICMAYRDGEIHYKTGDVFWNKNGTSFAVEYVSTPIRDRGILTGAVVVFRDMSTFN